MKDSICKYYEFDNWEYIQQQLIQYYEKVNPPFLWHLIQAEELRNDIPDVMEHLEKIGVIPLQLIFFGIPGPTTLTATSPEDSESIYIHVDRKDSEDILESLEAPTFFQPSHVLNIPLINCEASTTFFYDWIDETRKEEPWGGWGQEIKEAGLTKIAHDNVTQVDEIKLVKPAMLRVDIPHGVHNPTPTPRLVASIRISKDSPALKRLF